MSETNAATEIVLDPNDPTGAPLAATIRSAVNGVSKYAAYVEAHQVTPDTVKDHARALAVLAYPNDAPVQKKDGKRTRFGNAVQAAAAGLRSVMGKPETGPGEVVLRVSLSGEGGGTTIVPEDHPLYAALASLAANGVVTLEQVA
jgi:hypothetical protein